MSRIGMRIVCVLVALICGSAPAATTTNRTALTLADVVQLLGERNPRILASREAIASARADRRAASAYPNPRLGYDFFQSASHEHTIFDGEHQEAATIEFPLLIPGQRSSRIAKADRDIAAAQAHVLADTGTLAGDAVLSFTRLLALQERASALTNSYAGITVLKDAVVGRRAEGAASDYDVTRVELQLGILGSRVDGARSEIAAERAQLASLLGLTNALPFASGSLQPWNLPSDGLSNPAREALLAPLVAAADREADAAQAAIKTAQRNRWPELSVSAGRTWTRDPYGAADYVGMKVELPIFDTRRAQVDKAESEARAAEARRQAVFAETEATIGQLLQSVERRQAAFDRQRTEIVPRLERLKQMSADAYRLGRHTLLESLDAEQARLEVALENVTTTSALLEAQIRLLVVTGRLVPFLNQPKQ